jgi:glycosyltransferase involved in cell wall biosynthesis
MLLANPDIAKRVRYLVIGDFGGPYGDYLYSLAQGSLKGCLYLLGYQSNEMMEAYLQKADFCVNLRYPNSEVCSKSLIDQMAYENPVIVLNQGIFHEIPNDCVVKIQLENELIDMADAFRYLLDNEGMRHEIGSQALHFIEENCTPEVYATRFKSFLEKVPDTIAMDKLVTDTIFLNRLALTDLSFNQTNVPSLVNTVWSELSTVSGAISINTSNREVISVWFGFPYIVNLRREGITRFMLYMLLALLENYPIECEIWTYAFNEEEIRISFEPLLKQYEADKRVRVITEQSYKEMLEIPLYKYELPTNINETQDNLSYLAKLYSKASCFITAIVYLDNVIGTGKPIFVPVHDLGIHVHYDDFITMDPLYKARHVDIRSRAEHLARSGAFMFCESKHVLNTQVHNFIASIDDAHTGVIYFPVFVPKNIEEHLIKDKELRHKFGLKKPYLFYPTQVRPYKNVFVLIKALSVLRERNIDVDLVLTGKPSDVPEVEKEINKYKLSDKVICLSDVTEGELFSLYRSAAAAPIPTLFEGGFPLQAMEALYMGTPIVLSDIPVVRDRIEFSGLTIENCGLELFNPHSSLECANALERVILNHERTIASQKHFSDILLTYNWKDAAIQYYNMFFHPEKS